MWLSVSFKRNEATDANAGRVDLSGPPRPSPELYNTHVVPLQQLLTHAYKGRSVSQLSRAIALSATASWSFSAALKCTRDFFPNRSCWGYVAWVVVQLSPVTGRRCRGLMVSSPLVAGHGLLR